MALLRSLGQNALSWLGQGNLPGLDDGNSSSSLGQRERLQIMRIVRRQAPPDIHVIGFASAKALRSIQEFITGVVVSLKRTGLAIRDAALWIYHAPARFGLLIVHVISVAVQRVKAFLLIIIRVAVIGGLGLLALLATLVIIHFAWKFYTSYQAKKNARKIEEARVQSWINYLQAQQSQREYEQHRYQEQARREEAQRTFLAEQQREADENRKEAERKRVQEEEQRRRMEEVLRWQQRLEDLKLYTQWKSRCDKFFEAGTGVLPHPPFWPCSEPRCREDRHLKACCHNLERLFRATGDLQNTLREETRRWHPNRRVFHTQESSQRGYERIATEITQAIQSLLL